MDGNTPTFPCGHIDVTDMGPAQLAGPLGVGLRHHSRYTWRPPECFHDQVDAKLAIVLDCFCDDEGIRRFVPADGFEPFIHQAFSAGLGAMIHQEQMDGEQRASYRNMSFIFQLARKMREHNDRRVETARDLFVRPRGRGGAISHSLLPDDLGRVNGLGKAWSISTLTKRGREAARSAGVSNPTNRSAIAYGFFEAARLNPLLTSDDRVRPLVQMALFDSDSIERPKNRLLKLVTERLLKYIHSRLGQSQQQFDRGFFPGHSNLIKAIADQPKSPGKDLDFAEVRKCILWLGWESYLYMSGGIHMFGKCFCAALPSPLSLKEQHYFAAMYLPQAHFGGLPFVLIKEHAGLLAPVLCEFWENPLDRELVGVLHRVLAYYGEIAPKRRAADLRFKKGPTGSLGASHKLKNISTKLSGSLDRKAGEYTELAERLAVENDLSCDYCEGWKIVLVGPQATKKNNPTRIELICKCGRICQLMRRTKNGMEKLPDHTGSSETESS